MLQKVRHQSWHKKGAVEGKRNCEGKRVPKLKKRGEKPENRPIPSLRTYGSWAKKGEQKRVIKGKRIGRGIRE